MSTDNPPSAPNGHCNVNEGELDEATKEKLRGDAIGDTLYSEKFVLETLLKFSDLKWCTELEDDLCFLWDMTVEKDVCDFLITHSFPAIACTAIAMQTENRFIEIVIGTLANIMSVRRDMKLTEEDINVILKELETDDHLIMIQILRFIIALTYMSNQEFTITEDLLNKLVFILNNSMNRDLLGKCLEAVARITLSSHLGVLFVNNQVLESTLTAYQTLMCSEESDFELETQEKQLAVQYLLEIIKNIICAYKEGNEYNQGISVDENSIKAHTQAISEEIVKLLSYLSIEENLIPITERFEFFLCTIRYIFQSMNISYSSGVFINICKIVCLLKTNGIDDDSYDSCVDLICYFLAKGLLSNICVDLDTLPLSVVKECISCISNHPEKSAGKYLLNYEQIKKQFLKK